MSKRLALLLLAICPVADATTYNIQPGQNSSMIQRVISGASRGDTVSFAAGTYNITSSLNLKCGVTYTGPTATPATAILNATFTRESAMIFNLYSGSGYAIPCTQPTTIEYFNFENTGGIYVKTSFTNITITHNQFTNMACCNSAYDAGIYFDGSESTSNTAQILSNATVTWNVFGADQKSCESPTTGAMENWDGSLDVAGNCAGMQVQSTVNGLVFEYNKTVHIGEGVGFGCPSGPGTPGLGCEPLSTPRTTRPGVTTSNVTAMYNDFAGVHRIAWEEQPQATSGIIFQYNSYHDPYVPFFGTFDLSFACCENGARAPYLVVENNVLVQNTPNSPCPSYTGYGIEAHGMRASFSHNMVEGHNGAQFSKFANPPCSSGPFSVPAIAWGFGDNPRHYDNNYVCGPWFDRQYVVTQNPSYPTPSSIVGNIQSPTCSAVQSAPPTFDPPSGPANYPLTVTLTDPGHKSGPRPLGNTSIWYTTDGSTPVPGSGTAKQLPSGGKFSLGAPGTVKAVGMWGSGANPTSYPPGYGFVPSEVRSAHYGTSTPAHWR
jgi:hypothetical protein